jgi:hypothetical protein
MLSVTRVFYFAEGLSTEAPKSPVVVGMFNAKQCEGVPHAEK